MTATDVPLYVFGIMQSSLHMAWVKALCGRMKSDYRYSPAMYNNFPWIELSSDQEEKIEKTAQAIIEARNSYPQSTLEQLYNASTGIAKRLNDAHIANDRAVLKAYGLKINATEKEMLIYF